MNPIDHSAQGLGRGILRFFAWVIFVTLAAATSAQAVSLYSGASVGTNGTVYGWGVTDATWSPYNHTAYATATLTSPRGRTATYNRSAANTVRADVSLAWDSTDLGIYTERTVHSAFCVIMSWFIHEQVTQDTTTLYDFTVNISPSTIQPSGLGATYQMTVTVQTNPVVSRSVTLQDPRIAGSGGHPTNHPATLPSGTGGTFNPTSGSTNSSGTFTSTYTAPIFAGQHQIKATMEGRAKTSPTNLSVKISGLGQLTGGANYYNSNTAAGQIAHPDNWWGTTATRNGLVATANAYVAQYPGERVPYNDLSLLWGGKFDGNSYNWTGGHNEHRVGRNTDVNVCGWSQDRRNALWGMFVNQSIGGASGELDECGTNNCWHITW